MEKKTCKTCGKTWIAEKYDQHPCTALPKKPRKSRTKADPDTKTDTKIKGSALMSIRRMS
jgi:hypothetical protein